MRQHQERKEGEIQQSTTRQELATFLGITFGVSTVFYWLIFTSGGLARGPQYVAGLMWAPGVSALITRLVFHRNARSLGWRWPGARWAALAYLLPLAYSTAAYAVVWLVGLGGVDLARFQDNALRFILIGSLLSLLMATGEELGWRGLLVPTLSHTMPLGRTALFSGGIWVVWHAPLILFGDYNQGTPKWYAMVCFHHHGALARTAARVAATADG